MLINKTEPLSYIFLKKHGHTVPLSSISKKFDGVSDYWNVSYMLINKTEPLSYISLEKHGHTPPLSSNSQRFGRI